jgi:tetratricopeptide (TPR) repeat protein
MKPRLLLLLFTVTPACGWNVSRPFDREAPSVKQAIVDLNAGDASSAASRLEEYLSTGPCKDGSIGTPDMLKRRPDGTLDLGLSLFGVGERFGLRFGQEQVDAGIPEGVRSQRHAQVECARRVVEIVGDDPSSALDLRAKALYLDGNISFLDGAYEEAVRAYDRALVLAPGLPDAGDRTGRDAAWNRAIALERIEDEKDAGHSDGGGDGGGPGDSGSPSRDGGHDKGDSGSPSSDAGSKSDPDAGSEPPPEAPDASPEAPDAASPPPTPQSSDDRMLDQLENARTLQQEQAKRFGKKRPRGMADK